MKKQIALIIALGINLLWSSPDNGELLIKLKTDSENRSDSVPFTVHYHPSGTVRNINGKLSGTIGNNFADEALQFLDDHKTLFGIENVESELKVIKQSIDNYGMHHLTLQQVYKGIPLMYHLLKIHTDIDGHISTVSSVFFPGIETDVTPTLTEEHAVQFSITHFGMENTQAKEIELVIYKNNSEFHLSYRVDLSSFPLSRRYIVDAKTGEILIWNTLTFTDGPTIGSGINLLDEAVDSLDIYEGDTFDMEPIQEVLDSLNVLWDYNYPDPYNASYGAFNLIDESEDAPSRIYTISAYNSAWNPVFVVNSESDIFSSGTPSTSHRSGVSAHDYHIKSIDYFNIKHGRNGWDDEGGRVIGFIDYGPNPDMSVNNAFYNFITETVHYGIGGGSFRPFTASIDVAAHELTHGITWGSSGLIYENQSGAMNESLSDIFGYLVEAMWHEDADWLMGEDLYYSGGAIRSLSNPPAYGDPDNVNHPYFVPFTDNPTGNNDYGGVHSNSGIPNKAFYMMITGGNHYGIEVPPLSQDLDESRDIAANIWYIWNTEYLFPTDDFDIGSLAMLEVVSALYPGDSDKYNSVHHAWMSVGVAQSPVADVEWSGIYVQPETGELQLTVELEWMFLSDVHVPNVSVNGDDSSSVVIDLFDDGAHNDGEADDDIWGGTWSADTEETVYDIEFTLEDTLTNTLLIHEFYYDAFTTMGPIVIENFQIVSPDSFPNPGEDIQFTMSLLNNAEEEVVTNVSANVYPGNDECIWLLGSIGNPDYGDIPPGGTSSGTTLFRLLINPECEPDTDIPIEVRITSEGNVFWTDSITIHVYDPLGINPDNGLPAEFALLQNYPNPFNPITSFRYELPEQSHVTIVIYDMLGREVRTLVNTTQDAGFKLVIWNATNDYGKPVSAGVYLYQINAGDFVQTKKMVLLK